jgi:protein-L-isoaspartate(D-aspartate) O-methyltransferase
VPLRFFARAARRGRTKAKFPLSFAKLPMLNRADSARFDRRSLLKGAAAAALAAAVPRRASADVPKAYDWNAAPPMDNRAAYIQWMQANRGEDPKFLGEHYDRFLALIQNGDLWDDRNKRAFLLTPREEFVTKPNLAQAYEWHYLDIGYGVSITGPHTVARMTNSLDIQRGDKVLEVGTGSGYQSAYLANLTDRVFTIEIIKPLFDRTGGVYADLIRRGYNEYTAISRVQGDGYYGWQDQAPFDKVIVTCGIDHVPPPLLQQMKPNGVMVIPVGPPGAQHVLRIVKQQAADGSLTVARSDIYHGSTLSFVPFTKLDGAVISGTHNGST